MARASSGLFQSHYGRVGNFELSVTNNSSTFSGASSGGLLTFWRDNDAGLVWRLAAVLTDYDSAGSGSGEFPVQVGQAYRFPCWVEGTDTAFHGVCVLGTTVHYFAKQPLGQWIARLPRPPRPGDPAFAIPAGSVPLPNNCSGAPAFLQSSFGTVGNFEVIVPVSEGGMSHFWVNNDSGLPGPPSSRSVVVSPAWQRGPHFGRGNLVEGVRLIHSDFGNLEVIALERTASGRELVFYWQNGPGGTWSAGTVLPESQQVGGQPGFIQSSFQSVPGQGNLEVVAPAADGGLMHWFSFLDSTGRVWRRAPDVNRRGTRVRTVHLIQSNFGGNFEVIAETGGTPYGYGTLQFYWRDSGSGTWSGPFRISPT
jgi:hypothetical protein